MVTKFFGEPETRVISGQVFRCLTVAAAVVLFAGSAMAGTINTFTGQDNGAPVAGPFPSSSAAQAGFKSAAGSFGSLNTITFEGLPVGYSTPFTAAPGVTVTLTGGDFGNGLSGISNTTFGNVYGFNVTPGGSQWLGFAEGTATFSFANPTNSFGFWLTGLQTVYTGLGVLTVTFADGTSETLDPPVNVNGGAEYFAFTDTTAIDAVTISDPSNDAWGIDDVTYNSGAMAATPEPSSFFLLGTGALGLAGAIRRKLTA
jgi:hypothetical protein